MGWQRIRRLPPRDVPGARIVIELVIVICVIEPEYGVVRVDGFAWKRSCHNRELYNLGRAPYLDGTLLSWMELAKVTGGLRHGNRHTCDVGVNRLVEPGGARVWRGPVLDNVVVSPSNGVSRAGV